MNFSLTDPHSWKKILVWLLFSSALVPLFYVDGLFYPFITSRVFLFRTIVEITLSIFLILLAFQKISIHKQDLQRKIVWLPLAFLFASFLSGIFGVDFSYSFWSTFSRADGLLTLSHLVVFFYLLYFTFTKENWKTFLYITCGISILVAGSAFLEEWGLASFGPDRGRSGGTINNAAFLASYLLITFPLNLYAALISKHKPFLYKLFLVGAGVTFLGILLSETRGAIVGIVGAGIVLGVYNLFTSKRKKVRKVVAMSLIALVVAGGVGFIVRDSLRESNIPVLSRIASISLDDATTKSRLFIWKESIVDVAGSPLLGYGNESFETIYNKHFDPSLINEEWFDRSHNIYLDRLLGEGILGLALYILMLFFLMRSIWMVRHEDKKKFYIFSFLVLAYAIQNFFVFDSINTSFLFFALLAYWYKEESLFEGRTIRTDRVVTKTLLIVISILSLSSIYYFQVKPIQSNILLSEGYTYQIVDTDRSIAAWKKGIENTPQYSTEFGYQVYDSYINKTAIGISEGDLVKSFDHSVETLTYLLEKYPWNARLYVYLSHIIEDRPVGIAVDEEMFLEIVEKGIELSPKRKQIHYILANYYFAKVQSVPHTPSEKEDFEKAISALERYAEIAQNFAEPKVIIANFLLKNGYPERAEPFFQEAISLYTPSRSLADRIITYYLAKEEFAEVEPYFEYITETDPNNTIIMFDLAHIYNINGKRDLARELLLKIESIDPSVFETDPAFINEIFKDQ